MNAESTRALREAVEWRLLGLLFERPRAGHVEELGAVAATLGAGPWSSAVAAAAGAGEGAYLALLGPGGPVSPRATTYRGMEDPGAIIAELSAFYEAFAFRPRAEDPPDHVAVEAGFVGFLWLKEAAAAEAGHADACEVARAARQDFVRRHFEPLAQALAGRLDAMPVPYLAAAAQFALACSAEAHCAH